jgi:hypothetical protein
MLAHQLGQLRQEGARSLPDTVRFIQYAKDLLTFLDDLA